MPVLLDAELRDFAYYRTGGPCQTLYAPTSTAELARIVGRLRREETPFFLLGGGTNSLVSDEPYPGAVIVFRYLNHLHITDHRITAGAGMENSQLARAAAAKNLAGAAWMYRLPGQLGGTVRMNARCYGGEISQIVSRVETVSRTGEVKSYTDPSVFRGYKDTVFMDNGDLITEVELALEPGDADSIWKTMNFCETDRTSKGQFEFPSCGCVFKNDYRVGVSSGMLLDAAGAKELAVGGAEVSPKHANFVYNKGATSRDILELTLLMREAVYEKFGVWMDYEMEILGVLPEDLEERVREQRTPRPDEKALAPLRAKMRPTMPPAPEAPNAVATGADSASGSCSDS